jgi:DNA primase catalytic core
MNGKDKNDIIDHIKDHISILEVLHKLGGLGLQKAGHTLKGKCPTNHPSKSGTSFNVITDKNFCYCHSCGKGGGVIDLAMLAKNLSFREALHWFNDSFNLGYNLSADNWIFVKSKEQLQAEDELKTKTFLFEKLIEEGKQHLFLPDGKDALSYLTESRKYDPEIIKNTELFYLPPRGDAKKILFDANPEMSQQIKDLKLDGYYGDNFRLAFPYRDRNGMITGVMKRATEPKGFSGINWDGKEIKDQRFDSSSGLTKDDLFGLHKIKSKDTVIIVEGYFDAMYLYELGIDSIVAVGQAKLSKSHLTGLLKKGIKTVILAFDKDNVGPDNTVVAVKLLLRETTITPYVLDPKLFGDAKDPDELVRERGINAFKELLPQVKKGVSWVVEYLLDKPENSNPLENQKNIDEVMNLCRLARNPLDKDELISVISAKLKRTKAVVKDMIKASGKGVQTKGRFWCVSDAGLEISMKDYIDFIIDEGFAKYYLDKDYTFIQMKQNIVKECSLPQIKDHILSYIDCMEEDESGTKQQLYETLYNSVSHYFSEGLVECIPPQKITFKRDTSECAYVYYENGYVCVAGGSEYQLYSYENLESPIWEHIINQRPIDLILIKRGRAEYEQFLWNVSGGNEDRFLSICSAIGYMLHDYKQESNAKAIVLCDQMISDNPNGRTGKSLIGKALEKIKNVERVDGKNFDFKPTFTFQMVKLGTQIIDFNDVKANFDFERLFSVITDGMSIEYKNKSPFVIPFSESPKIMISTNYTIKGIGSSFKDRMFEIEFSDYYNPNHKPKDDFGHDFFTGWDSEEWNRFDNFMLECLQLYLDEGLIGCAVVNLTQRKLIDQTSAQFVEFAEEYIDLNEEYNLALLFTEFKNNIGFENDMFDKCPVKQNTFTSWLPVYAHYKGAVFQKRQSNSRQLVKLAACAVKK